MIAPASRLRRSELTVLRRGDSDAWSAITDRADARDVFFSPEYLEAAQSAVGGEAECVVYTEGPSIVAYPYIRRRVEGTAYFDITSQYGFGGYVSSRPDVASGYADAFHEYCRRSGIVSEFVRFHPFYGNERHLDPTPVEVVRRHAMVCVDLSRAWEDVAATVTKEVWKKVRKAGAAGVEVLRDDRGAYFDAFVAQYHQTMAFRNAAAFYFFPEPFYRGLRALLGREAWLFVALHGGEMIGALLVLHGPDFAYNFLSSSRRECQALGTNDALQIAALECAARAGARRFLLGGGLTADDSLFRYKARFSPDRVDYVLGRRVHLPDAYEVLCRERMRAQGADEAEFYSRDWFPLYRSDPTPVPPEVEA